ncbi:MAG: SDR family oxidoreductase [Burkholderiaceae bacterium]|nr:SDR family oxidoreductase [Burkholderiaceae bacterium]
MRHHDLLLFGATRNTGFCIAQQACAEGETVAAMVRPGSNALELRKLGVTVVIGDAFEKTDCMRAVAKTRPRRAISVLGGKNTAGRRVDAEGNINVIRALEEEGVDLGQFVLMTSMGSGEQYDELSESVKEWLGGALLAKTEAENTLKASRLPCWSIVRPGGLNNAVATGNFCLLLTPDKQRPGYLSRSDVATATLAVLDDPRWSRCAVTIQKKLRKASLK